MVLYPTLGVSQDPWGSRGRKTAVGYKPLSQDYTVRLYLKKPQQQQQNDMGVPETRPPAPCPINTTESTALCRRLSATTLSGLSNLLGQTTLTKEKNARRVPNVLFLELAGSLADSGFPPLFDRAEAVRLALPPGKSRAGFPSPISVCVAGAVRVLLSQTDQELLPPHRTH